MQIKGKTRAIGLAFTLAFGSATVAVAATNSATDSATHAKSSESKKASATKKDSDFMKQLAQANIAEIEVAKLAQSKSKDEKVLEFSKHMITDHTAGLEDVKKLAAEKGVTLPTEPDKAHKQEAAKLSKLDGEKFDKAYLTSAGLKDHEAAKDLVTKVSQKADDSELKALAEKMSVVINKHLEMVQQVVRK